MSAPKIPKDKEIKRWLRALEIAKCLFDEQGYHVHYLDQIEVFIKTNPSPAKINDASVGGYPRHEGLAKKRRNRNGTSTKIQVDRF